MPQTRRRSVAEQTRECRKGDERVPQGGKAAAKGSKLFREVARLLQRVASYFRKGGRLFWKRWQAIL